MKKKVVQLIHGFTMGGAETLVKEYCLKLDKEKYDLTVLCFYRYGTPYEKILEDASIRLIYIDDFKKRKAGSKLGYLRGVVDRCLFIKNYVQREKPDVIHSHLAVNSYVLFAKPGKVKKIVHTVHSEPKKFWGKNFARKLDLAAAKKLAKKYGMQTIALHEEMQAEINEMFHVSNTLVLNNGIDFKRFEAALPKKVVRERENIPQDAYVIGHVGRFIPLKNHKLLVNAFEIIAKEKPNAFLMFVGNGPTQEEIQGLLKEKGLESKSLILSGRTDIPDLLNAMDVFSLPSWYEGVSIALVEAQKMGLSCVISDTISEKTVLSNLITKLSIEAPIEQWADRLSNHKVEDRRYYGLEEWDMARIVQRLQEIYES